MGSCVAPAHSPVQQQVEPARSLSSIAASNTTTRTSSIFVTNRRSSSVANPPTASSTRTAKRSTPRSKSPYRRQTPNLDLSRRLSPKHRRPSSTKTAPQAMLRSRPSSCRPPPPHNNSSRPNLPSPPKVTAHGYSLRCRYCSVQVPKASTKMRSSHEVEFSNGHSPNTRSRPA